MCQDKKLKTYTLRDIDLEVQTHSRGQGEAGGNTPQKCLAYLVILCLEMRRHRQNTVARLKLNILTPLKFWVGYASVQTPSLLVHEILRAQRQ